MIGAGTQARTQFMGLGQVFDSIEEVRVWDINEKASSKFVEEMKAKQGKERIYSVETVKDAVQGADIIVTTTPSRKPLVSNEWVNDGAHINCIGADAPGKQELDPAILIKSKIVVDDWNQSSHGGEINVPVSEGTITEKNVWGDICEIVAGLKKGRTARDEITVFTSTGLAIQDAAAAKLVHQKALKQRIGKQIDILNV